LTVVLAVYSRRAPPEAEQPRLARTRTQMCGIDLGVLTVRVQLLPPENVIGDHRGRRLSVE